MTARGRLAAAIGVVALAGLLGGCDVDGRVQVRPDGSAHLDATVWDRIPERPAVEDPSWCTASSLLGGVEDVGDVTLEVVADPGGDPRRPGCHVVAELKPTGRDAWAGQAGLLQRGAADGRVGISAHPMLISLLGAVSASEGDDGGGDEEVVVVTAEPTIPQRLDVTVEMPGPLLDTVGASEVHGSTVRFTDPAPTAMLSVASLDGATVPSSTVLGAAAGLGVLLGLAAAGTARLLRRRPAMTDAAGASPAAGAGPDPDDPPATTPAPPPPPEDPSVWARDATGGAGADEARGPR